jgi:cyclopropane-fatty-acyl-phospholipid synthase
MRVLDIGCGWGGFLSYATSVYGIVGIGITTSDNQVKEATQRTADASVSIINMDYRDLTGTYDRIVSVGMFEHVGHKNYKEFFSKCESLLEPDGEMLLHTIGVLRSKAYHDPFMTKYIFPGGQLPSFAQIAKAAEPNWVIEDAHNIGQDYDKTLMAWHSNINSLWHEIPSYDSKFQRMWNFYLLSCAGSFRSRNLQLWQIVMRKKGVADEYVSAR